MGTSPEAIAVISLGLIGFVVLVFVVGIYELHSLPGRIAESRNHPQAEAIAVSSVLGLLVFPLWMFALVWAYAGVVGATLSRSGSAPAASPRSTRRGRWTRSSSCAGSRSSRRAS